ncbi:hypothetical protein Tsubulata_008242 [Turnera subulata]|uniref:Pectinesterase inhibitor domain-containing protein n=1 Tax=Turnera subulata TaxID=218843 RepID=A0A9Q0J2W6_9ROSI|nr:hypothetical protein Tsubulata_008242 [Turnera subulata]
MSTTTSMATILLLFLALAATTSCVRELEILQMVRADQLQVARGFWVHSSVAIDRVDGGGPDEQLGVALMDCGKLYEETNHRTCLDGLKEKGLSIETPGVAQNLTALLGEALALYGRGRVQEGLPERKFEIRLKIAVQVKTTTNRPPIGRRNGGMLASWTPATSKANFVVARDGSGIHKTINEALAALGRMGVSGDGFWARDMTFENTASPQKHRSTRQWH